MRLVPFACLVSCLPAAALAEAPGESPTILVTASRTGEGAAAAQTNVTADMIARLQPVSLIDALNDVAGVRAISTGGVGGGSYVSIRGGEPNFTLVLLDGVRVNDPTNSKGGGFDFSLIDPAAVQSLEINRGASSAVHGSDALSGVINIRLLEPTKTGTSGGARFSADTLGQIGGGATLAHGWDSGALLVSGSAFDSRNADPGSSVKRWQGLARARQSLGDFDAVALGLYTHNRHRAFAEDSGGPDLAVLRNQETGTGTLWTGALAIRHKADGMIRPDVSVSYSRQLSDVATPAIAPGVLSAVPALTADNRLNRLEAIADVGFYMGPLVATVGAAWLDERARSLGSIDFGFPVPANFRLNRKTASGFAEATLTPLAGLSLNGAVRYDAVDGGPKEWTGRGGIAWAPIDGGPSLFARVGEGFKLPSFYALGHPLVGNPNLRPERSRNHEAGIEYRNRTVSARVAYFDNRFRDLIDFDPVIFKTVNRDKVRTRGVEGEASWQIVPAVRLAGSLTYLDVDSADPLRNRPHWQGNARAVWQAMPKLELGGIVRFNSSFYDSSVPTGLIVTDGHAEVDASAGYRFTDALKLDLAVRNIGNSRDWKAVGFPSLGRSARATFSVSY